MQDKREMAKLILAGMLMAASLPANTQAENFSGNEMYLAVAGCGGGCGGGKSSTSLGSDGEVADAAGQMSTSKNARTPASTDADHRAYETPRGTGTGTKKPVTYENRDARSS